MMQFIKKYYIYGIYILTVLISIGIYILGVMQNSSNIQGFKGIESDYSTAMSLSGKAVHDNQLKFLNDNLIKAKTDEETVNNFCTKTSSRPLLYKNVFPSAKADESKIHYIRFAEEYTKAIDRLYGNSGLNAGDKPTQLEEKNYLEDSRRTRTTGGGGAGIGMEIGYATGGMGNASGSADQKLLAEYRENKANDISIYADQTSFVLYDFWKLHDGKSGTPTTLQIDSWLSQIAFWIQEDVVISINKINDKNKSVKENPIKRLVEISFAGLQTQTGSANAKIGGGGMAGGGMPMPAMGKLTSGSLISRIGGINTLPGYVIKPSSSSNTSETSSPYKNSLATPWSNRFCDELIDVLHFNISVIMASDDVNEFINALQSPRANIDGTNQRNQITVLEYNIIPVNVQTEELSGYYYGSGAISKVEYVCEYVFFKDGYSDFVPTSIDQLINPSEDSQKTMMQTY